MNQALLATSAELQAILLVSIFGNIQATEKWSHFIICIENLKTTDGLNSIKNGQSRRGSCNKGKWKDKAQRRENEWQDALLLKVIKALWKCKQTEEVILVDFQAFAQAYPFLVVSLQTPTQAAPQLQESQLQVKQSPPTAIKKGQLQTVMSVTSEGEEERQRQVVETLSLHYPTEVVDGFLYLGNAVHARCEQALIAHLQVTHVVNAAHGVPECKDTFACKGVQYMSVTVDDEDTVDIARHFSSLFDFVEQARQSEGARVLIHCRAGVSRSATLCIYYLMRAFNFTLPQAFCQVKIRRPCICPNLGFRKQLREAEKQLRGYASISENQLLLLESMSNNVDFLILQPCLNASSPPSSQAVKQSCCIQ